MMRTRWLAALLLAAVALIFATTATGSGTKAAASGGTFRLGTANGIDSLNPYVAFNQDSYSAFEYIYPVLVQYDSKLHFAPFFATSWHHSKDGKTWTFKTQPHAKWSDGKPLTAADAAWTINTDIKYKDGGAANEAGLINHITARGCAERRRRSSSITRGAELGLRARRSSSSSPSSRSTSGPSTSATREPA